MNRSPFLEWIERAAAARSLFTIDRQVTPERDLAAIAWLARRSRGCGCLFANIAGFPGWRVASQILTTRADWSRALGIDEGRLLSELCARLRTAVAARYVRAARVDRLEQRLPLPVPAASARSMCSAVGILILEGAGDAELFLVRVVQQADGETLIALDTPRLEVEFAARASRRQGEVGAALVFGCDPALYLAAAIGTFGRKATFESAGGLVGRPVELSDTAGRVLLPADTQAALMGTVNPADTSVIRGVPSISGRAGCSVRAVRLSAGAAFAKPDPILFAGHIGAFPADWGGIAALAIEVLTLEHLRNVEGGLRVLDVRCLPESGNQLITVCLAPRIEGQAKTALLAALSGPAALAPWAVAVDEDCDAADPGELFWSIASRTNAQYDVAVIDGAPALAQCVVSEAEGTIVPAGKWFIDSTIPQVSDRAARQEFERAKPKNHGTVDIAAFHIDK